MLKIGPSTFLEDEEDEDGSTRPEVKIQDKIQEALFEVGIRF